MAFSLKDIIVSDLKRITIDLGSQTFEWKGEDYSCIPSSRGDIASLEVGGFSVDADLSMTVLKELFVDGILPKSQQKITYKGRGYRIITVRQDSTDAFIRLILVDDSRGI